jgi:hypothetical protein
LPVAIVSPPLVAFYLFLSSLSVEPFGRPRFRGEAVAAVAAAVLAVVVTILAAVAVAVVATVAVAR